LRATGGLELGGGLVGDVRPAVQDPGAGKGAPGDVDCIDVAGLPRYRGREIPGTAAVVEHPGAWLEQGKYQLVGQDFTRPAVSRGFRGQIAVIEIVRRKREEAHRDSFSRALRGVGNEPFDPAGAEEVLAAALRGATDQCI
jgi:hypothetical protein